MRNLWRVVSAYLGRNAGAYLALGVVLLFFALLRPEFRQPSNLLIILDQSVEIAVVAVGMTAIILTGGIDLSVGSIAALGPFLGASLLTSHHNGLLGNAFAGVLVALGVGAIVGLLNGLAITKTGLPPFIATLGMMSVVRGAAYLVSHGSGISSGFPDSYKFTAYNILSLPGANNSRVNLTLAILVMGIVFVIGHLILSRTRVGRAIYAIGGNEISARLSGLNVDRVKIGVYIVGGLLAALGGLIEVGTVGGAVPDAGKDLELNAIAAAVIGGTSLSGGRGSLAGTFAGALLMQTITNGLILSGVDSNWQRVAIGGIIILAVALDTMQKRRISRA